MTRIDDILHEIRHERGNQDNKWGGNRFHPLGIWFLILGEEFGEACKDALDFEFATSLSKEHSLLKCREELIQVAAVAAAIVESIDNHYLKEEQVNE